MNFIDFINYFFNLRFYDFNDKFISLLFSGYKSPLLIFSSLTFLFHFVWIKTHPRIGLSLEVELSITAFNLENGEELAEKALEEMREVILSLDGMIRERK